MKEKRKLIEEIILREASLFPNENMSDFKNKIESLSDDEFVEFVNKINESMNELNKDEKCHVMAKEDIESISKIVSLSSPSDCISINNGVMDELSSFWRKKNDPKIVPADIFFAGTIPILDMIVKQKYDKELTTETRFCIFKDYQNYIELSKLKNIPVVVGAVILKLSIGENKDFNLLIPIIIQYGFDVCMSSSFGYYGDYDDEVATNVFNDISFRQQSEGSYELLSLWYGIQLSLLHPDMKKMYENPKEERIYIGSNKKKNNSKNKKMTRVIRSYNITKHMITESVGNKHDINCLCWYVSGHFRHYKNGKKVFIQPYWKGALRDIKKNLDDIRIREVKPGDLNS